MHPSAWKTALAVALTGIAAPASAGAAWDERLVEAREYAESRSGRIAFAVVDERGRLRGGLRARERFHSASLAKTMLMVAYLSRDRVGARDLSAAEGALLGRMVRRSDNRAATRVLAIVGHAGLHEVARRARMRDFATAAGWSDASVTAADQARLFFRIDRLVPRRHRSFARAQLAGIVRPQRWGIPRAIPPGYKAYFKGGWRREGGARLVHQAGYVERPGVRVVVAILSDGVPWHGYGTRTIRVLTGHLLADLARRPSRLGARDDLHR